MKDDDWEIIVTSHALSGSEARSEVCMFIHHTSAGARKVRQWKKEENGRRGEDETRQMAKAARKRKRFYCNMITRKTSEKKRDMTDTYILPEKAEPCCWSRW